MSAPPQRPQKTLSPGATWTSRQLLVWIKDHLAAKGVDSPQVCAELLVAHVLECDRLQLYMEPDRVASTEQREVLRALVGRAAKHEPVQLLVGTWPFHGRELEVGPCTLIPRPATETLVDRALEEVKRRGPREVWRMLDLCTGSGCIAVSLAAAIQALRDGRVSSRMNQEVVEQTIEDEQAVEDLPVLDLDLQPVSGMYQEDAPPSNEVQADDMMGQLSFIATDIVEDALALAQRNCARVGVTDLLELRLGSLYDPLHSNEAKSFNLICANPPYVSDAEYEELDRNVRDYEPATALRGGPYGLNLVEPIIRSSPEWLCCGGLLLVEIGHAMHERVREIAIETSGLRDIEILLDHEGYSRVLVARAE